MTEQSVHSYFNTLLNICVPASISGLISNTLCHPLDTLKTRMFQMTPEGVRRYTSLKKAVMHARNNEAEGLRALWKGLSVVLTTSMPLTTIYFLSYESSVYLWKRPVSRWLKSRQPANLEISDETLLDQAQDSVAVQFASGVCAQIIAAIFFTPTDVIKERMQANQRLKKSTAKPLSATQVLAGILSTERLSGLYRGYWVSVCLWAPYGALFLGTSQFLKNQFHGFYHHHSAPKTITTDKKDDINGLLSDDLSKHTYSTSETQHDLSLTQHLLISSVSAGIAAFVTNGLDLVKVNLQIGTFPTRNVFLIVKQLMRQDKLFFLRGSTARLLYLAPRTALSFAIYEYAREMYH